MNQPTFPLPAPTPPGAQINVMPTGTRSLDVFCSMLALPVLAIGVLLMTVITRLVSPGPVFFRQERIGYRGRRFKIFKFRTMTVAPTQRFISNISRSWSGPTRRW